MSSAKACLIYSLSPFVAALFAYIVLKERLTTKKWIGLISVSLASRLTYLPNLLLLDLAKDLLLFSWAELAIIVAVFASVYGWILLKKLINEYHYTPIMANGLAC